MDAKQKHDAKQLRRKQNRALRKLGLEKLTATGSRMVHEAQIGKLNRVAEREMRLRYKLGDMAAAGVPGAAKAKRKLNDVWTNRNSQSLKGFWNPQA